MLDEAFSYLGLGTNEARAYLALLRSGGSSAGTLAKRAGLTRSSLYGFLQNLEAKGLVKQSQRRSLKLWYAEPPENIFKNLQEKTQGLQNAVDTFSALLPKLVAETRADFIKPRYQYFEGINGVTNILRDMLVYRDIVTIALWPVREMLDLLGEQFFEQLNRERIRQNIYTRAIWPNKRLLDIKKHPYFGVGKEFKREIRVGPSGMDCTMGYWAYQNRVAFVSSRKECFGFIVESAELVQMLAAQFEMLWTLSTPISVEKKHLTKFLKTVKQK